MTDDRRAADRMLTGVLAPMLRRSADAMRELTLPIGSPEHCAHAISAYAQAGAERIFVWPLARRASSNSSASAPTWFRSSSSARERGDELGGASS